MYSEKQLTWAAMYGKFWLKMRKKAFTFRKSKTGTGYSEMGWKLTPGDRENSPPFFPSGWGEHPVPRLRTDLHNCSSQQIYRLAEPQKFWCRNPNCYSYLLGKKQLGEPPQTWWKTNMHRGGQMGLVWERTSEAISISASYGPGVLSGNTRTVTLEHPQHSFSMVCWQTWVSRAQD